MIQNQVDRGPGDDGGELFHELDRETTVVTYADSYHDFDAYRAPRFERVLVTGRACLARGATVGRDAEAWRRAPADVAAFLRRVLKPETH